MSNTYRAEQLLRRIGVVPGDLSLTQADPRWPAAYEKLRLVKTLVEVRLMVASERGLNFCDCCVDRLALLITRRRVELADKEDATS